MVRKLVVLLLSLCFLLAPSLGFAQDEPLPDNVLEARDRYKRGTEFYKAGDFKLALIEFNKAYAVAPHFKILYNIGQVNMQLNNYAAALTAFRRYLSDGGDEIEAGRRAAIQAELPMLIARTAEISVSSNVEGAEVQVDNAPVGTTPMAPVLVDAGERVVSIHKDGRTARKRITVAGNEELVVTLDLAPAVLPIAPLIQPTSGAPTAPGPDSAEEPSYVWVGWVVSGVLGAAAIGTGIAALGAQGDLEELKGQVTTQAALDDASSKATSLSIAADVLIGAAVVSGAVTLIFTISEATSGDELAMQVGPGALGLRGTF